MGPQILKCFSIANRVAQEYSMNYPVEDISDGFELFLACCVPNLQLEHALLNFNETGSEVDSDCHIMLGIKLALSQSQINI